MVRIIVEQTYAPDKRYIEAAGLHDDTKPTGGVITGSLFLEVDTGDVYAYDETGAEWDKVGG